MHTDLFGQRIVNNGGATAGVSASEKLAALAQAKMDLECISNQIREMIRENGRVYGGSPERQEMLSDMYHLARDLATEIRIKACSGAPFKNRRNGRNEGHVYFVRLNGIVKIGHSIKSATEIAGRYRVHAPGAVLEGIALSQDMRGWEARLHRKHASRRANGEWFAINNEEVKAEVNAILAELPDDVRKAWEMSPTSKDCRA